MRNIIFDIETGPLPEAELEAMLPPFDPAEVKTGNIKDPEKVAAKIAEAESNHRQAFFDRAALDPLTGRVLAIGMLAGKDFEFLTYDDEDRMLDAFWSRWEDMSRGANRFIGFNCLLFDLPFLVRRSWKLGVKIPHGVREGRYWSNLFIDLREVWQLGDRQARGSLDAIARHLGVGEKSGSGKDFAALLKLDHDKAIEYLRNDLVLTARIAARLGVIQ